MVNETEKKKLHRIFICIDFPEEAIKEIARAQEVLGNWKFTGKMTELENLHLTLKFLGEIDENKLGEIRKKLKEIRFKKMELGLGNVGSFGYRGKPRIIWIKILGKEFYELQKKIDEVLSEAGFIKEERFMGHVAVARVKYVKDAKGFKEYIDTLKLRKIRFFEDKFKLMESELRTLGPVYTVIEEYIARDLKF